MRKIIYITTVIVLLLLTSCSPIAEDELRFPDIWGITDDVYGLPYAPDPRLPAVNIHGFDGESDGILRLSMRAPQTLNPLLNRDVSVARILGLLFEPLAVLDEQLRAVGHLAALAFSLDFTSVVVTIPTDAIWSDGLPVTADDLIFSVDKLRSAPEDVIYRARVANISSITRIDERTAQIFFEEANPAAGYSLLFPVIPRHYFLVETDPGSRRNLSPVGNGLFMFESMKSMQSMQLVRNPNTFRTPAEFERVEIIFLPDNQVELYAFDRGLADAIHLPLPEWPPSAKELRVQDFPAMYFEFIGFNYAREVFHCMDVRQGIAHVFDADEAIETLYLHHAVRAATPIHPYSWMADASVRGFPHDMIRARVLLREVPRDAGAPWVIIVGDSNAKRTAIAYRLASGLRELGIYTEVRALSDEDFLTRLTYGDYDLFIGWIALDFAPDFAFLFPYDAELEWLFAAMRAAATEAAFGGAVSALQHAFAEHVPVLGLAFRHSSVLTGTRISASVPPTPTSVFLHVNYWQIQ